MSTRVLELPRNLDIAKSALWDSTTAATNQETTLHGLLFTAHIVQCFTAHLNCGVKHCKKSTVRSRPHRGGFRVCCRPRVVYTRGGVGAGGGGCRGGQSVVRRPDLQG